MGAITFDIIKAPSPNPITTIPVIKPFLSGNHLETVATGVTYPKPNPIPPTTPNPK